MLPSAHLKFGSVPNTTVKLGIMCRFQGFVLVTQLRALGLADGLAEGGGGPLLIDSRG